MLNVLWRTDKGKKGGGREKERKKGNCVLSIISISTKVKVSMC